MRDVLATVALGIELQLLFVELAKTVRADSIRNLRGHRTGRRMHVDGTRLSSLLKNAAHERFYISDCRCSRTQQFG